MPILAGGWGFLGQEQPLLPRRLSLDPRASRAARSEEYSRHFGREYTRRRGSALDDHQILQADLFGGTYPLPGEWLRVGVLVDVRLKFLGI